MAPPLQGFRVLDVSTGIAGAYCTKLLADYGARVIKIESPRAGDPLRRQSPFQDDAPHPEKSGLFLFLNTGKEGVTLDLETQTGRHLFRRLCKEADAVVESFPPDKAQVLGISYDSVAESNPALVVTSLNDFGSEGPRRNDKMTNLTVFAVSAYMNPMGDPKDPPVQPGGPFSGFLSGMFGCYSTLIAYLSALYDGQGQQVEVSRLEAVLASLIYDVTQYSYTGVPRQRHGRHYTKRQALRISVQPTMDDYIASIIGPGYERWAALWEALMGMPEVLDDERFLTLEGQEAHIDELEAKVQSWLSEHKSEEVFHLGQSFRLLFAQFLTMKDVFHNEHLRARNYFQQVEHPVLGEVELPGTPWRFSATPADKLRPAPTLGQHNQSVYAELLGLERADLVLLRAGGVI